jgi:hypothetical protein
MFRYSAFGLTVSSELELPQLPPGCGNPDIEIRLGTVQRSRQKANNCDHIIFNSRIGGFHMKEGRQIVVDPAEGADPDLIQVILTGRAMAYLLRQRGWLPLHASGIAIDGQAILFIGPSGSGKSSAAAALRARGHTVVTDDVGMIQTIGGACHVRPAYSALRLTADSMDLIAGKTDFRSLMQFDKMAVHWTQEALPATLPVRHIYVLDFGEEAKVQDLPPLLAAVSLSLHSFVKRSRYDVESIEAHVRQCASVAGVVPVSQITRRRSFAGMDSLVRLVEQRASCG